MALNCEIAIPQGQLFGGRRSGVRPNQVATRSLTPGGKGGQFRVSASEESAKPRSLPPVGRVARNSRRLQVECARSQASLLYEQIPVTFCIRFCDMRRST